MSDSRKSIQEDEDDLTRLLLNAGLSHIIETNPYSDRASILRQGVLLGYRSNLLLAFVDKEEKIRKLHLQIKEAELTFEKFREQIQALEKGYKL